jgi:lysozyme
MLLGGKTIRMILVAIAVLAICACAPPRVADTTSSNNTAAQTPPQSQPPTQAQPPTVAPPAITARPSASPNIRVCPGANEENGVDVSDYDPGTVWPTVAKSKSFTYVKATEGITSKNPYFPGDWVAAKAAGMLRGPYHFFHPKDDPAMAAQSFVKVIGTLEADDLPPVLDWEVTDGLSAATQISRAKTWLTLVEAATGKVPMIYVDPSFWNNLGNPAAFARYPLYIADYKVKCPTVPPPWTTWTIWQDVLGKVTGVKSSIADIDVFNGTAEQLMNFAQTGAR